MKPLPATDKDKNSVLLQWGVRPDGKFRSLEGVCTVKPPRRTWSNSLVFRCKRVSEKSCSKAGAWSRKGLVEVCPPLLPYASVLNMNIRRPGVHWLQDPDTKEYNFDSYLGNIPQVRDFAFDRLPGFVPSSQDTALIAQAREAKCKYVGSTSSLTGILTQIYLLLSEEKLVNLDNLSEEFQTAVGPVIPPNVAATQFVPA